MHNVVLVDEGASLQNLPDYLFGLGKFKSQISYFERFNAQVVCSVLQFLENGSVQLLKDQEDPAAFSEDLNQVDDVVVLQLLQNANLAQSSFSYLAIV